MYLVDVFLYIVFQTTLLQKWLGLGRDITSTGFDSVATVQLDRGALEEQTGDSALPPLTLCVTPGKSFVLSGPQPCFYVFR